MPRVTTVKKARNDQGTCGKCGTPIAAGDGYRWTKFLRGPKLRRCTKYECRFRASDLTRSDIRGSLYSAQEAFEDAPKSNLSELESAIESMTESVSEVMELIDEKVSAMEDGFGHRIQACDDLEDRKYEIESWHSELEDLMNEVQSSTYEHDPDDTDPDDEDAAQEAQDEFDRLLSECEDAVGNCPE